MRELQYAEGARAGEGGLTVRYCGATDKGGRSNNEDAYDTVTIEHASGNLHLLAVADGLGGHAAGEVASKLAVIELVETVNRRVAASLLILHQRYTEGRGDAGGGFHFNAMESK